MSRGSRALIKDHDADVKTKERIVQEVEQARTMLERFPRLHPAKDALETLVTQERERVR